MNELPPFKVTYDSGSDVLYITKRREAAARGVEDARGIVWRYDSAGDLISVVVLDFRELWSNKQNRLAEELSRGFHIPMLQAKSVIKYAVENGRAN